MVLSPFLNDGGKNVTLPYNVTYILGLNILLYLLQLKCVDYIAFYQLLN